jgi:CheY-like chemotaxis protein
MDPLAGRSALLVAETRELRHAITSLLLQWGMKVVALADLLDLPESAPLPDLLIACEEDILGQGGFGILRERLGSIPLVTLYRPVPGQWTTTPVAPDFNSEDTSLSGQQLIRIPRPVLREPLRHAVQAAVELGLMDSASPIRDSGLVETVAARYPLRVLVVEDNPTNLRVALLLLSNLGYRADHVSNGQEAVDAVRETAFDPNRCYELILMDVHMPLMDGLEATRQIRRLISRGLDGENLAESVSQPYISALTADALAGDREKCLAAGMDDYLSKPMTLADLRRLVKRAYRARRDVLRNSV